MIITLWHRIRGHRVDTWRATSRTRIAMCMTCKQTWWWR